MQQKIKEQEQEVQIVERKQQIEIAEQEIQRKERELDSKVGGWAILLYPAPFEHSHSQF